MEVIGLVGVCIFAFMVYFLLRIVMNTHRLLKSNQRLIDEYMAQNGFRASRTIRKNSWTGDTTFCHLYVDDNKKKWLLTSPYFPQIGKIRDFSELEDFAFFDEEGFDLAGKYMRACIGTALAIGAIGIGLAGAQVGNSMGGKLLGLTTGIASGVFADKIAKFPMQHINVGGASKAFGIILKTKDCTDENPVLVFDYCAIQRDGFRLSGKGGDKAIAGILGAGNKMTGLRRSEGSYRHNVALIQEMFVIFDEIIRSNQ